MRSLSARIDVLFYWNGIPIFRTSKGKVNWFEKSEIEKSGVKLQLLKRGKRLLNPVIGRFEKLRVRDITHGTPLISVINLF